MRGIVCFSPPVCFSLRTDGQILMKSGVIHHIEATFPKSVSHVATWIKSDCQYGGVPGLILLKMRIGLNFVRSELILGSVRLCELWAVSEDLVFWLVAPCFWVVEWSRRIRRNAKLCCVQVIQQSAPLIYVIFDFFLTTVTKSYCFMRRDAVCIGRYRRSRGT